ncbi:MAG: hypothetical protein II772_06685 [Lachnospiraceae bacterium]|nr:hypothetical protein [Lachnospiraceae bacterium]
MYTLSPITERVERIRAKYRDTVPFVDTTRYRIVTEFYTTHRNLSGNLRRAYNFKNLCEKIPCTIHDDEVIVGSYTQTYKATALYPENSIDWMITEIQTGSLWEREVDPYQITEEDKEYILATADYWLGECMNSKMDPYIPQKYQDTANNGALYFTKTGICPQPVGHFAPNYQKVIREGLASVKAEAEQRMLDLEEKGFEHDDAKKYRFYRGVVAVCEGMITFAKRYSAACAERAEAETDPARKAEFTRMADTLGWIMENPCRDFRDAIQTVWFYQMCVLMDANMHGTSVGRFDQYIGDFAERDLAEGKITREEMQELVDMYYLKVAECNKVWAARTVLSAPGYTSGQLITVGGVDKDGRDATNVITYMALEAVGRLVLHSPPQALRLHKDSPKELWDCALEVNKRAGGVPSFYSDESVMAALMAHRGVTLEDARNYCLIGCVEPSIGGSEWPACGGVGINSYMNFVNVFLMAINNGKNPMPNMDGTPKTEQFGPETGYLYEMTDIEQVKEAYLTQMRYWIKWNVILINMFEEINKEFLPQPVVSACMVGCMESGRDVTEGGAKYNSTGLSGIGLGNVTDCFSMIENVVFKEKFCTMRELYDALLANWEGYEELHDYINGHRMHYGNDIPEVDRWAKWVAEEYADCANAQTGPRGKYAAGMYPVTMNVVYGKFTHATPDGRVAGSPLSDGISALQGQDKNGPTAILNSVGVFDQTKYSNGTLLNMKFHPLTLASEDGFNKLEQLMKVYFFEKGGMEMQLNIVSVDTLRDAQEHPGNYKDLVVRIAGFSAYFVDVYKAAQDDLIRRTELSM